MPKKLFSAKPFSGSPSDSVDNIFKSVFLRIPDAEIELCASGSFEEKGALVKLRGAPWSEFLFGRYDALWGVGTVKELFFVLCKLWKMPYIINFHSIMIRGKEGPWQPKTPWFLRKFLFSRASLVITPSEYSAGTVRRYFPDKRVIGILNGVDTALFHPSKKNLALLQEKYGIHAQKPIIAFVGTLQMRKRPDVFIEVARRFPDGHFVMVGREFPEHDFVAEASGLENFQHIPVMPREDVAVLFASSMAFVFPSLNEPAAAVILEAMASGTVPILSKSGGNGEFLKDGESGLLIANDEYEIDNFTQALRDISSDSAQRETLALAARHEAEEHGFDVVAEAYRKIILSLWNSH